MELTREELTRLTESRAHMICIFQTIDSIHKYFIKYNTYIVCSDIDYFEHYKTTQQREDMIYITRDDNIIDKIKEYGYSPKDNIIFTFFVME